MDIIVENHLSIFLLRPMSEAGSEWLDRNIGDDAPMFGNAVACEPRYVGPIVEGMLSDGLEVQ